MQRYFVQNSQIQNQTIMIIGNDYHHIRNVMRMKPETKVYVCDEDGHTYLASVTRFTESAVNLRIIDAINHNPELKCRVTMAMGLTRQDKQEEVLRRITELGAAGFIPVAMERSLIQVKDPEAKLPRMEMIVKEAAEQSHRSRLLTVHPVTSFSEFLAFSERFAIRLFAYEEAGRMQNVDFPKVLKEKAKQQDVSVVIMTGPEGGISPKEAEILKQHQFLEIGLGPRILRCETAPLYIMSAISYELELVK